LGSVNIVAQFTLRNIPLDIEKFVGGRLYGSAVFPPN